MINIRHIAPVGTPISLSDNWNWLRNISASNDILEDFRHRICTTYNTRNCFFVSSGRAALYLLLRTFQKLRPATKREVIIPSYTSFSVPSAIAKSGLTIRVCDIETRTLDYDYQKLSNIDFSNVLCIFASNLYGIPGDLERLGQLAKEHDIFMVDDAAQCMGAEINDKFCGTFGDAGIYSLGKGKNITSCEGGILVTDSDDIAALLKPEIANLPEMSIISKSSDILQLLVYSALLHPNLCWIPANIGSLSTPIYSNEFSVNSYSRVLGSIGVQLFKRIADIQKNRIENAAYFQKHLAQKSYLNFIEYDSCIKPVFLRYPVIISDDEIRNKILYGLKKIGVWTVKAYPMSVMDIEDIKEIRICSDKDAEAGRAVAEKLVTLPTHPYVTPNDRELIILCIKNKGEIKSGQHL